VYRAEFDRLLASPEPLPRAIMLFGECDFFIDHYTQAIVKRLPADIETLKLYHNEFNLDLARSHLQEPGLFGSGNLLILKTEKKLDAKTLKSLLEPLKRNPGCWLILHYEVSDTKDAKAKSAHFDPKKQADHCFVRFFEPKPQEAATFLKELAAKKEITLGEAGAHHLLRLNDYNLALSIGELEKLAIIGSSEAKAMDQVVAGHAEGDLFRLLQQLLGKRPFIKELDQLFLEGMDEIRIVGELQKMLSQLFLFFCSARISGQPDSREILGYKLPREIEQARASLAIRLNRHQYTRILESLSDLELLFKSPEAIHGDKRSHLLSRLIEIQTKFL
jgi:DNA polymerase-3 subunit delta